MYLTDKKVLVIGTETDVKTVRKGTDTITSLDIQVAWTFLGVAGLAMALPAARLVDNMSTGEPIAVWSSLALLIFMATTWAMCARLAYHLVRYNVPYRRLVKAGTVIDLGDYGVFDLLMDMLSGSSLHADMLLTEWSIQHPTELYSFITNEDVRQLAGGLAWANMEATKQDIINKVAQLMPTALQPAFATHAKMAQLWALEKRRKEVEADAALERRLGIG